MKKVLIISGILIAIWLIILCIPSISNRVKSAITMILIASPIPPIP